MLFRRVGVALGLTPHPLGIMVPMFQGHSVCATDASIAPSSAEKAAIGLVCARITTTATTCPSASVILIKYHPQNSDKRVGFATHIAASSAATTGTRAFLEMTMIHPSKHVVGSHESA